MKPNRELEASERWWQAVKEKGELTQRIDEAAERFPLANGAGVASGLTTRPRLTLHVFAFRGVLAAACVASLALALTWSLDRAAEHRAFSAAVAQSISLWDEKNTWAANLNTSVQAAFFLPTGTALDGNP